jgi:hypothetical protein
MSVWGYMKIRPSKEDKILTAKQNREDQVEPQAPRLSDVTDGHVGETSEIAAIDDVERDQDRDG